MSKKTNNSKTQEPKYFDVLKSVLTKTHIDDVFVKKHFAPFLAIKWAAITPEMCIKLNTLNTAEGLNFIPKEVEYRYIKNTVNMPKNKYIPFPKGNQDYVLVLKYLAKYYLCNQDIAERYLKLQGKEKTLEILNKLAQTYNNYCTDPDILKLRKAIANLQKDGILWVL